MYNILVNRNQVLDIEYEEVLSWSPPAEHYHTEREDPESVTSRLSTQPEMARGDLLVG